MTAPRIFLILTIPFLAFFPVSCANTANPNYVPEEFMRLRSLGKSDYGFAVEDFERSDPSARYYKLDAYRDSVEEFYATISRSKAVAKAILFACDAYNVPPSLAFALANEESGFESRAVNRNFDSVDRGIFQLNSKSFPFLKVEEAFDLEINARYGVSHLAFCLKNGGNDIAALAMYNAGLTRVSKGGTPRATLNYIFRISSYRANIEALFEAQVLPRIKKPARGEDLVLGTRASPALRALLD